MKRYVASVDAGTTSVRCLIVDDAGQVVSSASREHRQIFPQPGWVEHDPVEIWTNVQHVITQALAQAALTARDISSVGITNQRETALLWHRATGKPVHNAIVWQDLRTDVLCHELAADTGPDRFRAQTGLPLATYFTGPKLTWLLRHHPELQAAADAGQLLAGTIDTWLVWNLTGGPDGGVHATDGTNASRTLLMNLRTLDWDAELTAAHGIPAAVLPDIRPSIGTFGTCAEGTPLPGVPIHAVLGDQQSALIGQACFTPGSAKNTYGTGNFVLLNTGTDLHMSEHGLLTTVAYQHQGHPPVYALEGSIAVTGSLVQWLRDNLEFFAAASDIEPLAASVTDTGGAYLVPAFSGLFAPYWRSDARGVLVGLTRYVTKAHIARAALEAVAFQTCDVMAAMVADGANVTEMKVDGGMVANDLLMQLQADLLGVDVVRPAQVQTTAIGAAYAAGVGAGWWNQLNEVAEHWQVDQRWSPQIEPAERQARRADWARAVQRTLDWANPV